MVDYVFLTFCATLTSTVTISNLSTKLDQNRSVTLNRNPGEPTNKQRQKHKFCWQR
uniref:Uncharacterized protein n=1 Tax=Lepeophtheirus salmonis TaxID=72036 RepID=A0A0K2V7S4_LEPSM